MTDLVLTASQAAALKALKAGAELSQANGTDAFVFAPSGVRPHTLHSLADLRLIERKRIGSEDAYAINSKGLQALQLSEAGQPIATLNETQIRVLEQFQEHADSQPEHGWMIAKSGYQVPYRERMHLATLRALVDRGYLEKWERPGHEIVYRITETGRQALQESKATNF